MADTDYNGAPLVAVTVTFLFITWISVLLRAYVRIKITKAFQADDCLILIAQIIFSISCTFILVGVQAGIGRHEAILPEGRIVEARKYESLATLTYIVDAMFIKLSIAVFLLRIAVADCYRWILKISIVIVTLWSLAIILYDTFRCSPIQSQWDDSIPHTCTSSSSFGAASYALSAMTIISDWLYALLPIPMIWSVQMTKQAKITVALILSLGIFASIATLIRLQFLVDIKHLPDILFKGTQALTWSVVEPGTAITAASLVSIRPLLRVLRITGFKSENFSGSSEDQYRSNPQSKNWKPLTDASSEGGRKDGWTSIYRLKRSLAHSEEISDGASEEYSLEGMGGILKTVDVTVSEDYAGRDEHFVH